MAAISGYTGMIRATIEGRLHGQVTNNVLFFGRVGELGNPDWATILAALGAAIITCAIDTLLPALSTQFTLERVRLQAVDPTLTDEVIVTTNLPDSGEVANESLPSFTAAVLSFRTGMGGKSKRGRMYIAGVPENGQTDSLVTAAERDLLQDFVACLIAQFTGNVGAGGFRLGVYSRKLGGVKPMNMSLGWVPVTSISQNSALGTMRSRKLGRGA
jgi:hypothetical protein